ncbi:MAG: PKD domain-containing protein [Bacteroidia bacterium]
MKRHLTFLLLVIVSCALAQPQSSCPNADFEQGNFTNWLGETGTCCPISTSASGIVPGRHTIMSGPGTDPYSLGQIPVVAPGGQYSARLGNDNVGAEAEKLIYNFTVSPQTELFIYRYAVVLEDPAHDPAEQPRFEIRVFDQNGIDVSCGTYNVVASASIPGFQNNGDYRFKTWTTVGIELSQYMNQNVTIEFSTGDCSLTGHFGYAYVDCYCSALQINSDFCPGSGFSVLQAPPGFASYAWSNGATTQNVTIPNPMVGTNYTVTMTSVTGCTVSLTNVITITTMTADFTTSQSLCQNDAQFFDNSSVLNGTPIVSWQWSFGDGTTGSVKNPQHLYANAGNYVVTLISANGGGCVDTISKPVTIDTIPNANFSYTAACPGTPITFTDNTVITAGVITSWLWNFGTVTSNLQNPSHTYPAPGTNNVSLIVQTSNGCKDTVILPVTTSPSPVADFTYTPACNNQPLIFTSNISFPSGTITSYNWNFGDGTFDLTANPAHAYSSPGTYTVTLIVQGSNGCVDSIQKQVVFNAVPAANFTYSNLCETNASSFTDLSVLTGGSINAWNWNFGDGTAASIIKNPYHVYAAAGNYTVTLIATGTNGCKDTLAQNIVIKPSPVAAFNNLPVCPGSPVQLTDMSQFASGNITNWSWNFGDGSPLSALQNPQHIYVIGSYNVTLVVTGNNGCVDTLVQPLATLTVPNALFTSTATCGNLPVTFTDQSTAAGSSISSWSWNFGDGSPFSLIQNPLHTYNAQGAYFVSLIVQALNGCIDTLNKEVIVSPFPTADFNFTAPCKYDSVNFYDLSTVPVGFITTWEWNFGNSTSAVNVQDPAVLYNVSGTYPVSLIAISSNGCRDTVVKNITVKPLPVADFYFQSVCQNVPVMFADSSKLNGGTITSWNWDFGDAAVSSQSNPFHAYTLSGNYNVQLIVTGSNGCIDTLVKTVFIKPLPVAHFGFNDVCVYYSVAFHDSSSLAGGNVIDWDWAFGDGKGDTVNQNPSHTYNAPGSYNVLLTVTGNNGCSNNHVIPITVFPQPVVSFSHDTACINYPLQFTDLSSGVGTSVSAWHWTFGDGGSSLLQDPLHAYLSDTNFAVTLIVTSGQGCTDTVNKIITVYPGPQVDFSSANVCFKQPMLFKDSSIAVAGTIAAYNWNFGDSSSFSSAQNPSHNYSVPGNYITWHYVTNSYGCRDSASKTFEVYELPVPVYLASDTAGCKPLPVNFTSLSYTNDGNITNWNWQFGDGGTDTVINPYYVYNNDGFYNVSLSLQTNLGCKDSITKINWINVYPKPVAAFDFYPQDLSVFLDWTQVTDESIGATQWFYDFGDSLTSELQHPKHTYAQPGIYNIYQIVTNQYDCKDTLYKIIEVKDGTAIYIPNSFTPNDDGSNDRFAPIGYHVKDFLIYIFNRWGEEVFKSSNLNQPWDGTYKGTHAQEGVYVYLLKVQDVEGKTKLYKGTVSLVR